MTAVISDCGRYRYTLEREWMTGEGTCLFVMLNPSTADAGQDDPTIRRCIGFAQRWGYRRLEVGNLFAYRATDPDRLSMVPEPVGPSNGAWLEHLLKRASIAIAAWGTSARPLAVQPECALIARAMRLGVPLKALGLTKDRLPRHPLYIKGDVEPVSFCAPAVTARPIDDCPHCAGQGGRREEHCPDHGVGASLAREDAFYRKQDELERHGRCPEHPHEVRGRCPKCGEADRG